MSTAAPPATPAAPWATADLATLATQPATAVLEQLATRAAGLTAAEAARRLQLAGPNAIRTHHARPLAVLGRQLQSPLLVLLAITATVSFFVGQRSDAIIIGGILALSVGLGFFNEYRAELAAEALHTQIRHRVTVRRDDGYTSCDITELVPGDLVRIEMGAVVPADVRLVDVAGFECDESILTGESLPVEKSAEPCASGAALGDLTSCAFMGTIAHEGSAEAVVVATGGRTEFGRIALGLGERHPQTEFQQGLRQFSLLLVRVAGVLTSGIFVVNLVLHRPLIDALLFSLAIAVGITPQLLPAVVTACLASGSRQLAKRKVLVKRLVCIEDLGDIDVLFTDKTGTLTEGHISFERSLGPDGQPLPRPLVLGLVCNEAAVENGTAVGGNALDAALWEAPGAGDLGADGYARRAELPFDHDRRLASVLVDDPDGRRIVITKGAPESLLQRCIDLPVGVDGVLEQEFAAGSRVIAVASREVGEQSTLRTDDEHSLRLEGFLVFLDRPKDSARGSVARLGDLGITIKIVTGDNPRVAEKVCADLDIEVLGTLSGTDIDRLDDDALTDAIHRTTIFARVSPEQKSRIITVQRQAGSDVAFLGDGVNDAVALHHADVGISVDSATDVAKDAADIVLLEKDLDVLADGVVEGRRIFANTIKYALMGTSSNFGNMFSAAVGSTFLPFLPMLPSQILLNNLLYDSSQMAIPTDLVDEEQLERPAHWDIAFIRRFMVSFGPISSLFDFATFGIMLWGFHAHRELFRSGWFVESLATQTLVIFVIRTRRIPFLKSRPSAPLLAAALGAAGLGAVLPLSPLRHVLGFGSLPGGFFAVLAAMILTYLVLVEVGKYLFYRSLPAPVAPDLRRPTHHRIHRRAAVWSHPGQLPTDGAGRRHRGGRIG